MDPGRGWQKAWEWVEPVRLKPLPFGKDNVEKLSLSLPECGVRSRSLLIPAAGGWVKPWRGGGIDLMVRQALLAEPPLCSLLGRKLGLFGVLSTEILPL